MRLHQLSVFCLSLLCATSSFAQISFKLGGGLPAPYVAYWLASADFNGDGYADVATANANLQGSGSVSVFLASTKGTFLAAVNYPAPGNCQPVYIAAGDFNNDQKTDLFVSCGILSGVYVLPGAGDGTFGDPVLTNTPLAPFVGAEFFGGGLPNPTAPMADFNGDGNLDLVIPTASVEFYSTQVLLLLGNGDGSFRALAPNMNLGGELPLLLAAGDFNGDGKMDLAVVSGLENFDDTTGYTTVAEPSLEIGFNDGQGSFTFQKPLSLGSIPDFEMTSGDMNGDGKADIVLAGPSLSTPTGTGAVTLLGNGDGTFSQRPFIADATTVYPPQSLVLADLRHSGTLDVIAPALSETETGISVEVAIYQNQGDGTLDPAIVIPDPNEVMPLATAVADVNGDGRPDIILLAISTPQSAQIQFLQNQSLAASFTNVNAATYLAGGLASSSIVAAFGDGLAATTASAPGLPLPTILGGLTVAVTDSAGLTRDAPLFYVSPSQVNYAIPEGTATGAASITITTGIGSVTAPQRIVPTAGGIFNATGIAAADVYTYNGAPVPVVTSTVTANAQGALVPVPIDVGTASEQVYLILYGTGLRNHANPVTATVGSITLPVAFAGAQGTFLGEDQINLLLPQTLAGAGLVNVTLNVDGQNTNAVQIRIQ